MTNEEKQIIARQYRWALQQKENMKTVNNRKETISKEESKAALELQKPIQSEDKPATAIQRISTFKQLATVSRSARLAFGAALTWAKPEMLFNDAYRDGYESPPFFITKAFKYQSKEIKGDRLGIEIVLSNGKSYNVGFGLNEGDTTRMGILQMFTDYEGKPRRDAEPVGPFCITRLPTDKGNDYWNIVPYQQTAVAGADVDIPFVEIDEEIPF